MRSKKIHKMLKINTLHTFFRSVLGARTGLFTLALLLLVGCSAEKSPEKAAQPCGELTTLEYAKNLKIGDSCGVQMAEIRSIVGRDTLIRRFRRAAPPSKVVALSSAQIGYMLRLGEQGRIIAVGDGKYIADSALYQNVAAGAVAQVGSGPTLSLEKLMELQPQLVMSFATGGGQDDYERIEALGLPLMLTSEWQEEHPLAKAEWIKLYGMLFGKEALADSIYEQIKKNYDTISHSTLHIPHSSCPRVLVGMSYGGVWYAPGGNSYTAQLIKDAGGCYLWADTEERELRLPLEQVFALADSADIWINPSMFSTAEEILAAEPRAARIKAFREKRVYQNDNRKGPGGSNDFYESAVTYPEELLREMAQIFGQNADSAKNATPNTAHPRWYRNIFNF